MTHLVKRRARIVNTVKAVPEAISVSSSQIVSVPFLTPEHLVPPFIDLFRSERLELELV